jgi:bifunctional non-homologous end joining protein LigD
MRINQGQEFVVGGYTPSPKKFDALIFGYYKGKDLMYVARTRNGFTPAIREHIFKHFRGLEVQQCPFVNLPEARGGRWRQGLTAAKMKECRWLLCRRRHRSHNVECRTMPYAFWGIRFWKRLLAVARVWPRFHPA